MPIVRLSDFRVHSYEILVRFEGESPGDTQKRILEIEAAGDAPAFDARVLSLLKAGLNSRGFLFDHPLSVNVSGQSISDPGFIRFAKAFLRDCPDPSRLVFEVTETAPITNHSCALDFSSTIHSKLSSMSMDDFGTGYANEARFHSLPFDGLKIDGFYVSTWHENLASRMHVSNAVVIANSKGATTTAEFISGPQDVEMARLLGVQYGQGYYFGRPEASPANPDKLSMEIVNKFPGTVLLPA